MGFCVDFVLGFMNPKALAGALPGALPSPFPLFEELFLPS
jgi:hypothetical protein